MDKLTICVDFDGTSVMHEYPEIGNDVPHAVRTMKDLVAQGHRLILWTMRSDESLDDAVSWFQNRGIPLFGVQVNPEQHEWTSSRKCYANIFIDDAGFGAPLIYPSRGRAYLDWLKVREYFGLPNDEVRFKDVPIFSKFKNRGDIYIKLGDNEIFNRNLSCGVIEVDIFWKDGVERLVELI